MRMDILNLINRYDSFLNRKIKMLHLDKNNGIEIAVIENYNKKAKRFVVKIYLVMKQNIMKIKS